MAHGALPSQRDRVNISTQDMPHSLTWHQPMSLHTSCFSNDRVHSSVRYHIRFHVKKKRTSNTYFIVLAISCCCYEGFLPPLEKQRSKLSDSPPLFHLSLPLLTELPLATLTTTKTKQRAQLQRSSVVRLDVYAASIVPSW